MENNEITVDAKWLMDSCLCWAMRYCMYRKSYAVLDMLEMVELINKNREKFNEGKIGIIVRDLRNCSNERMGWEFKNVEIDNSIDAPFVAYDLIAKELVKNPDIHFYDYDWYVNCINGTLERTKREKPYTLHECGDTLQRLYDCDLDTISKAIAMLDLNNRYIVKTKYDGKEAEDLCFRMRSTRLLGSGGVEECREEYHPLSRPNSTIIEDYIVEILPVSFDSILHENKEVLKRMSDD